MLLAGNAVLVTVETAVVVDRDPVEPCASVEIRHRCSARLIVRADLADAVPVALSRWRALVEWWLRALPHYLVVAVFVGGGWAAWSGVGNGWMLSSGGSSACLSCSPRAAFHRPVPNATVRLRARHEPLGISGRGVCLMTDATPPFRLDMGGSEPPADAAPPQSSCSGASHLVAREKALGQLPSTSCRDLSAVGAGCSVSRRR